ncbi:MAG: glycosyltransferase family 9 protein, partial [Wenzhouxiangella sp.]|nr:glycosyltransferase family 9 protein [Wenzhouxiangella sp.]
MTSDAPNSICLLRLSALGDVCNIVPAVRAIQQTWPAVKLTWVIGRMEHRLLKSLPQVEFIVFDKKAGWRGFRHLRRQLGRRRFDILLHAQVSARANLLSLLISAERRIGFDPDRAREGHGLVVNEHIPACPGQHQALALQSFADHIGADTQGVDRALPVSEAARAFAASHQPIPNHSVLISPASSHKGRNWNTIGYAKVADWIIEHTGRPVILIGGPSEAEKMLGTEISDQMKHSVTNLIGKDTLDQALAMLERAACLISPDAGPAHFAAAMGTPVVGLYAATWSRRSGPLGSL